MFGDTGDGLDKWCIGVGQAHDNVTIRSGGQGEIVEGLPNVDGSVGAVEIGPRVIYSLLFFQVVILGGKELFEECPRFVAEWSFAPVLAGVGIVTRGADSMVGSLKNFPIGESNLAIRCVLDAIVDALKEEVDCL